MSDRKSSAGHILATAVFLIALSAVAAALVGSGLPFEFRRPSSAKSFLELALVAFIAEVMIYSVIYMIEYARSTHRRHHNYQSILCNALCSTNCISRYY